MLLTFGVVFPLSNALSAPMTCLGKCLSKSHIKPWWFAGRANTSILQHKEIPTRLKPPENDPYYLQMRRCMVGRLPCNNTFGMPVLAEAAVVPHFLLHSLIGTPQRIFGSWA